MIKEVSGDILLSKAEAIAHGVAPYDHFDSGLALSLREKWPEMYKDFRHYCHAQNPKSGGAWVWAKEESPLSIINLLTQEAPEGHNHTGRPGKASIPHVNHSLQELKKVVEKQGIKSVAISKLATGVGGLNWEEVRPIVHEVLGNLDADVYVYATFVKGQEAIE